MKIDFLKKRAENFLTTANYHFQKEMYPLAAFDLGQACQLYLKYYLFLKLRRYPKTHSLRELLQGIGKVYKKQKAIDKIIKENVNIIADLEEAYITSRYLPAEFFKEQVKNMKKFTRDLIKFLKKL